MKMLNSKVLNELVRIIGWGIVLGIIFGSLFALGWKIGEIIP
jgi:hypothetical protein